MKPFSSGLSFLCSCAVAASMLFAEAPLLAADHAIGRNDPVQTELQNPAFQSAKEKLKPSFSLPEVKPEIVFRVHKANLLTYSFPGSNCFVLNFHTTRKFDPASINPSSISVHLKYYEDGEFVESERLEGSFVKANSDDPPSSPSTILRWRSEPTEWASRCSGSGSCRIDISLYDTLLSVDGDRLDGNSDGTPGGHYYHVFTR